MRVSLTIRNIPAPQRRGLIRRSASASAVLHRLALVLFFIACASCAAGATVHYDLTNDALRATTYSATLSWAIGDAVVIDVQSMQGADQTNDLAGTTSYLKLSPDASPDTTNAWLRADILDAGAGRMQFYLPPAQSGGLTGVAYRALVSTYYVGDLLYDLARYYAAPTSQPPAAPSTVVYVTNNISIGDTSIINTNLFVNHVSNVIVQAIYITNYNSVYAYTYTTNIYMHGVSNIVAGGSNYSSGALALWGNISATSSGLVFRADTQFSGAAIAPNSLPGSAVIQGTVLPPVDGSGITNISAELPTNSLPLSGGSMSGPLTNSSGYYGNGAGLSNLPAVASAQCYTDSYNSILPAYYNNTNIMSPGRNGIFGDSRYTNSYSAIVGGMSNKIDTQAARGFVGGGFGNMISNVTDSAIGGGNGNTIESAVAGYGQSSIGGGIGNRVLATRGAIVGGNANTARGTEPAICGGYANNADGHCFVGGGYQNQAGTLSGADLYCSVLGGYLNSATGLFASAFGTFARAYHKHAFVVGDSIAVYNTSTRSNQVLLGTQSDVGIATSAPQARLDVNGSFRFSSPAFPSNSTDTSGSAGELRWDDDRLAWRTKTNGWIIVMGAKF